jgi:hypothetical protein
MPSPSYQRILISLPLLPRQTYRSPACALQSRRDKPAKYSQSCNASDAVIAITFSAIAVRRSTHVSGTTIITLMMITIEIRPSASLSPVSKFPRRASQEIASSHFLSWACSMVMPQPNIVPSAIRSCVVQARRSEVSAGSSRNAGLRGTAPGRSRHTAGYGHNWPAVLETHNDPVERLRQRMQE